MLLWNSSEYFFLASTVSYKSLIFFSTSFLSPKSFLAYFLFLAFCISVNLSLRIVISSSKSLVFLSYCSFLFVSSSIEFFILLLFFSPTLFESVVVPSNNSETNSGFCCSKNAIISPSLLSVILSFNLETSTPSFSKYSVFLVINSLSFLESSSILYSLLSILAISKISSCLNSFGILP
jgi:hypothetical protein